MVNDWLVDLMMFTLIIMKSPSSEDLIGLVDDKVDLVIGGPPCQAYSMAGRAQDPNSMKNDYRNYLFENFCFV